MRFTLFATLLLAANVCGQDLLPPPGGAPAPQVVPAIPPLPDPPVVPAPAEVGPPPQVIPQDRPAEVLVEEVPRTRWLLDAELGAGLLELPGTLVPPSNFQPAKSLLFPFPSAKLTSNIAARVAFGYEFERFPGTIEAAWEGYSAEGKAMLLGSDPTAAALIPLLEQYRQNSSDPDSLPTVMMRNVIGLPADLRSRATATLADLVYKHRIWTPREARGVTFQLLAGARYGNFFSDDLAEGYGYRQWVSNSFSGVGPIGGFRIEKKLRNGFAGNEGSVFFGFAAGTLFGDITQRFREFDPYPVPRYTETVSTGSRSVPFLTTELGLSSISVFPSRVRLSAGVRFSQYFTVGRLGNSQLDVRSLVGFVRGVWRF